MEQIAIACGNKFPPMSSNYPWLIAQDLDGTGDQTFYTIHDQVCHYQCRIAKLVGRCIRGYFHGWVILSRNNMWCVWNPMTFETINLPSLTLNNSEYVGQCCLSLPPDDPASVLLLTITGQSTFVFCRLGVKRKKLRWKKVSYSSQLKEIIGRDDGFLQCPTAYNGKVYAMSNDGDFVIQVDIIAKDGEALLKLLPYGRRPYPSRTCFPMSISLLKGTSTELFYIIVAFNDVTRRRLGNVYLFKWVMASMAWEEMVDIKDAVFFVDLACVDSVYYSHAVASELGGYIHIRDEMGKMMYSCNVEDKTISLSSMAYPTGHVSMWECRLEEEEKYDKIVVRSVMDDAAELNDDKIVVRSVKDDEAELNESHLLNLPFHLLERIMNHCIGVEYMCLRATCKSCHLAAPLIRWSNETASRRLQKYTVVSPWLMAVDKNHDQNHDLITFTDPMLGDRYFMKRSHVSIRDGRILCSRFGWLLFRSNYSMLVFVNPITDEIRRLPRVQYYLESLSFSAPPTSPDCMVVGFTHGGKRSNVCIHFVGGERTWVTIHLDCGFAAPSRFCFPTFCGQELYVLCDKGELYVFKSLFNLQGDYFKKVTGARSSEGEYFLVKCDQQVLLVTVSKCRSCVDVFEPNDSTKEWEKIDCLGRYTIYIGDTTCLCIEANAPEMENKIIFSRLSYEKGKIVCYSLETRRYDGLRVKNIEEIDGVGTEGVLPRAWIEPSWS